MTVREAEFNVLAGIFGRIEADPQGNRRVYEGFVATPKPLKDVYRHYIDKMLDQRAMFFCASLAAAESRELDFENRNTGKTTMICGIDEIEMHDDVDVLFTTSSPSKITLPKGFTGYYSYLIEPSPDSTVVDFVSFHEGSAI